MFKPTLLVAALAAALPLPALAVTETDLVALRAEFDQKLKDLQATYETRLKEMEARVAQAESKPQSAPATPARTAAANSFNPEISMILQGGYTQRKAGDRRPTGFLQSNEVESPTRGFAIGGTELMLSASIDPYLRGQATVVMEGGQANVEEAWFQTHSLGRGLTLKGGRYLSGTGYQNEQHPHAWDFADNTLMYQTLFGEHLVQDGVQLKWLAPTERYLEFGGEIGNGNTFPGGTVDRNGIGDWALFGHVGGDVGESSSWRAGLSYLSARPGNRNSTLVNSAGDDKIARFTGDSKIWIADFVWKWAPQGNPRDKNFKLQGEWFQRTEDGRLTYDPDGTNTDGAYLGKQSGGYLQGVYQFMPRWRVGLRYDLLKNDRLDYGANAGVLTTTSYSPTKWSLMTDYAPSEFSLFRVQWSRNHAMQNNPDDNMLSVQYVYSLGAHGAHKF